MAWRDRQGNPVPGDDTQDKTLQFLYGTRCGRAMLSVMIKPWVSKAAGRLMDTKASCIVIEPFIKKNGIAMKEYKHKQFRSFNDFFTRQIRKCARPIDREAEHLIAPCDCKLSVYPITEEAKFRIKGMDYTMESLLRDRELAKQFEGGTLLLFRLTVGDYHRYCYIDDGVKGENVHIPGVYYTVNPIAGTRYPIYKENTREYALLDSAHFGKVLMVEVGATMVGRIVNYHGAQEVRRGQEKGRFEFGGSTVILCLQKDAAVIDDDLVENTRKDIETVIKMGEKIGLANKN